MTQAKRNHGMTRREFSKTLGVAATVAAAPAVIRIPKVNAAVTMMTKKIPSSGEAG